MDLEPKDESKRAVRKLAAILHADVVGYSRLMGEDEDGTLRTLSSYREVMNSLVEMHHGRVVGTAGDSILAEFVSTFEALECAIEIQGSLSARNAGLSNERKMQFRIGINLGEVIVKGEDIFGEGVNIAARLEALAEPGGICISGGVHEQLKNKLSLAYEFLGDKDVKNVSEPVAVYRVGLGPDEALRNPVAPTLVGATVTPPGKWAALAAAVVVVLAAAVVVVLSVGEFAVWQLDRDPSARIAGAIPDIQATTARPVGRKASIAVLPFANMSSTSTDDDFTDGITEDIITKLAQFEDLDVISRNSVFTYKGKPVKVQLVGEELGVQFVLEGSVRTIGRQVRITAQLVEAATGHHLWAERYDRELNDVFALQDEMTRAIVRNLAAFAVKVMDPEMPRVRVDGVATVLDVRHQEKRIVIDHDAIEGYMAAMEMSYKVESAELLNGIEPGEKVVFTIDMENMTIIAIRPQGAQ